MTVERIHRWEIGLIAAAFLGATGVILSQPAVIVAAGIPLTYFIFASLNQFPETTEISVERDLSQSVPRPGERITVTLTVRNESSIVLTDIRIIDAVPDELVVVDGSPRAAVSLRPGTETELEYTVVAMQGSYGFGNPYVRLRTVSGGRRQTGRVQVDGTTGFSCFIRPSLPLSVGNTFRTGVHTTATAGEGLEFHTLREYQSGDEISRIDWRQYAKTGDLTTVEFNEQRTTNVMVVLDVRAEMRFAPQPGHPDGVELTAYAGYALFEGLLGAGHKVGLTGVGIESQQLGSEVHRLEGGWAWIDPGTGADTKARVNALYDALDHLFDSEELARRNAPESGSAPTATMATDGGTRVMKRFIQRLSATMPVVVVSTAMDDYFVELTRQLRVAGYDVTFISPNVTHNTGSGGTVEGMERALRLKTIRTTGASVVDWDPSEPLQAAFDSSDVGLL